MKLRIFYLFISCFLITSSARSQKKTYTSECQIISNLTDSAGNIFFDFNNMAKEDTISFLDADHLLAGCRTFLAGNEKIRIVSSGPQIDEIKKEGIFAATARRKNFFIVSKEYLNKLTGFRIFYPFSGSYLYWGFRKQKNNYTFRIKRSGWF